MHNVNFKIGIRILLSMAMLMPGALPAQEAAFLEAEAPAIKADDNDPFADLEGDDNPFHALLNEDLIHYVTLKTAKEVKEALESGANPNSKDEYGTPALHIVAERRDDQSVKIAKLLIEHGADMNIRNTEGQTALHTAIQNEHEKMVWLLLTKGVNFHLKNSDDATPLDMAKARGNPRIIELVTKATEIEKQRYLDARSEKRFKEMVENYAYYNCAFAYLLYYRQTVIKKTDKPGFTEADFHRRITSMQDYATRMMELFNLKAKQIKHIGDHSQKTIVEELDRMISPRNRKKKGFGKQEDMDRRCKRIAQGFIVNDTRAPTELPDTLKGD